MIRIHNKNTGWTGRERTDSDLITLQDGEVKLQVIKHDRPNYNPETQRIVKLPPAIDLDELTYTEAWQVVDYTEYEIAMKDWGYPEYDIRIIADIDLVLTDFGIAMKGWFELRGLPIVPRGDKVHLYCKEIQERFKGAVDYYESEGQLTIENKPQP